MPVKAGDAPVSDSLIPAIEVPLLL